MRREEKRRLRKGFNCSWAATTSRNRAHAAPWHLQSGVMFPALAGCHAANRAAAGSAISSHAAVEGQTPSDDFSCSLDRGTANPVNAALYSRRQLLWHIHPVLCCSGPVFLLPSQHTHTLHRFLSTFPEVNWSSIFLFFSVYCTISIEIYIYTYI